MAGRECLAKNESSNLKKLMLLLVIPAQAGIQGRQSRGGYPLFKPGQALDPAVASFWVSLLEIGDGQTPSRRASTPILAHRIRLDLGVLSGSTRCACMKPA
jgi:hypothetical protein